MLVRSLECRGKIVVVENQCSQNREHKGAEEKQERCQRKLFKGFPIAMSCLKLLILLEALASALDVMGGNPYLIDDIDPESVNEEPKVDVVALANAVGDVWAVMIKHLDADIACSAVNRTFRANDHARGTELETRHECLLSIQTIDDQIVLELMVPLCCVFIIYLLWNHSRVSCGSQVKESIDSHPQYKSKYQGDKIVFSICIVNPREA